MLLPYFFDLVQYGVSAIQNQMVPVTTPRLDCPPEVYQITQVSMVNSSQMDFFRH